MKTRILYIEDEPFLGKIVSESLLAEGFEVQWETDGLKVIEALKEFKPDLCILDIMLPSMDGYSLCRSIREMNARLPVIFLTAKTETRDLVKGFEAGGTDYIRKPFSMEELTARIRNQMHLHGSMVENPTDPPDEIPIGSFTLFPKKYELVKDGLTIKLSQRELQILTRLLSAPNGLTDRRELLLSVWGDDSFFNSRNLDVYIRKLRNHLEKDPKIRLQTIKSKGYLFTFE